MGARGRGRVRAGLIAACACLVLPGVALAVTGTYNGKTAQGKVCGRHFHSACVVHIRIEQNAIKSPPSHIEWRARCQHGSGLTGDTSLFGHLKKGKFRGSGTYTATGLGKSSKGPVTARETVTVTFVLQGGKALGSLNAQATVFGGSTVIDHCVAGRVHFTAHR